MKFKESKKLYQNNFDNITIKKIENKTDNNEYNVIITGGYDYPMIKMNNTIFTEKIDSTEVTRVKDLINYFLNNTKITYINEGIDTKVNSNVYLVGNKKRNMVLLNCEEILDEVERKKINDKYKIDRLNLITSTNSLHKIIFEYGTHSEYYLYKKDDINELYIKMNSKDGVLKEDDEKFLIDFVLDLVNKSGKKIDSKLIYDLGFYQKNSIDKYDVYLYIDNLIVKVPENIYSKYIKRIIIKHNIDLEEQKKLQLSMFDK